MERLLARVRQAIGGKMSNASIERICSGGFLASLLHGHHRVPGNLDPRFVTRSELIESGVPIRAVQKAPKKKHAGGGFVVYKGEQEAAVGNSVFETFVVLPAFFSY